MWNKLAEQSRACDIDHTVIFIILPENEYLWSVLSDLEVSDV